MRMSLACVDFEVFELSRAEGRTRKHPFDGLFEDDGGAAFEIARGGFEALTAGVAGVAHIDLVGHLLTREAHFFGVDNDYVVPAIDVRGEVGLVLSAQDFSDLRGEASEHFSVCVDDIPLFFRGFGIDGDGFVA